MVTIPESVSISSAEAKTYGGLPVRLTPLVGNRYAVDTVDAVGTNVRIGYIADAGFSSYRASDGDSLVLFGNLDDAVTWLVNLYKALSSDPMKMVLRDVADERRRQDEMWGQSLHKPQEWLGILTEEVGEVARAANTIHWHPSDEARQQYRKELIQVAAVAVAAVQALDAMLADGVDG